jgi:hypothetical protein
LDAENNKESCSQRNSTECKKYVRAHRSFNRIGKERDSAQNQCTSTVETAVYRTVRTVVWEDGG